MDDARIVVLVEDTAGRRGLLTEHGLALWIEINGKNILFDTGQGRVLAANAGQLGITLADVDAIVLSHGHYDHTGGLRTVLRTPKEVVIYAHPQAFDAKYARNPDGTARSIGISSADNQAVRDKATIVWVESPMEVFGGLWLTGPIPRVTDFEDTGGAFFCDEACTEPDLLLDDQAAFIETADGTVVVLGCAHAGIINTLHYIQSLTNQRPIHTVLGGMHLLNAGRERMDKTVAAFQRLGIQRLLPCHCTGMAATARLWNEFAQQCGDCRAGTVVELKG